MLFAQHVLIAVFLHDQLVIHLIWLSLNYFLVFILVNAERVCALAVYLHWLINIHAATVGTRILHQSQILLFPKANTTRADLLLV